MNYFEIGFLVALATICFGIFYSYRRSLRLEKERHERMMREIEENNARIRKLRTERRASMLSSRVEETKEHQRKYSDDRTMLYSDGSGEELLTQMITQHALNGKLTNNSSVKKENI